ncbi:PREDICTED: carboxylesterase 1 [Nelumbo nucifera]|uniref:Carboxylesterase 1 n=1 Tax=Nelumbo nucifera TaxID=4432 RepID=A0A1U8AX46_NELNU|nr:PREDICTED: carboxylesterase 1 [Nelumbo nucifera]
MADQPLFTVPNVSPYDFLQIVPNSDGSLTRLISFPTVSAAADHQSDSAVLTKDIPLNTTNKTWLRIYRPRRLPPSFSSSSGKLPLIVYYHGGGFIIGAAAWNIFHDFCSNLAAELPALVISVEYRLAPEHRLPAAYEDAVEVLHFIKNQLELLNEKSEQEEWLRELGDCSQCFLMGSSAGGNIAYHAGLRAQAMAHDLEPLKITGLILHQPFFGGSQRTESESNLANNPFLPLSVTDVMWELSLPVGSDRDHVYSNPMTTGSLTHQIGLLGRCLVTGCSGDLLISQQMEFVKMLEEEGVTVVSWFQEGGYHGVELMEPMKSPALTTVVREFIFRSSL